jgi:hypothetical protein
MMKMLLTQQRILALSMGGVLMALSAQAQISPTSPTTNWTPVLYPPSNPTTPDPFSDQQTGSKEGDIVGTTNVASLYTRFYNGGTPSLTDGQLAFRLRLAEEQNPPGYSGAAFIGVDGNNDGRLDIFLGVNNSGSTAQIGLWRAGTGANTSPSTTTIQSPASISYVETSVNYSWTPVNATIDPTTMSYDIDNGGRTDHFLTFVVPFADLVAMFATNGIAGINENSVFTYVAATATQDNSLNQDLNGVNGGVNSASTWQQLGALTTPLTATGTTVPEPSTWALIALGGAALILSRGLLRPAKRDRR